MGQCALRDIGFEFEDDHEKRQAFEKYLTEKANVKYPDPYLPKGQEKDNADGETDWGENRESGQSAGEPLYGRVTTLLNKMVQTDDLDEEQMMRFQYGDLDDAVQVEAVPHISPEDLENQFEYASRNENQGRAQRQNLQIGNEPLKLSSSGYLGNSTPPVAIAKPHSPNIRTTLAKMPPIGSTPNIFDGLESIDFRSPMGTAKNANKPAFEFNTPPPAGNAGNSEALPLRSRMAQYKGFENKYFRISHNRSPSPMGQSQNNIFDDDDDDFPYDDY